MTKGKNLKLKRRAIAKGSQQSCRQPNQARRTSESREGRQLSIYQQLRGLREPQSEARELRPGGETIITRLADILVIHAIRSWIAVDPTAQTGWFGALRDRRLGPVIAQIHRDPYRAWTLDSLAAEAAMSRSAFASRFTERVGEPAMHYVTRWKMHTAVTWLSEEDVAVVELARRLGYESEAAFSRAFKRFVGVSPGSMRKRKQQTGLAAEQQLSR
jgi:AraC-like DNA-binding protein